eukprot:1145078-Pelagomonas_calceolata.AAC.4
MQPSGLILGVQYHCSVLHHAPSDATLGVQHHSSIRQPSGTTHGAPCLRLPNIFPLLRVQDTPKRACLQRNVLASYWVTKCLLSDLDAGGWTKCKKEMPCMLNDSVSMRGCHESSSSGSVSMRGCHMKSTTERGAFHPPV